MASKLEIIGHTAEIPVFNSSSVQRAGEAGEKRLLMEAIHKPSSSLESAFCRLQEKAQRPTQDVESKLYS
jgi:hypothetical protein